MPPFRIVKVIDVVRDLGAGQFGCQIRVIEGKVAFEVAEERFRYGIVPTVTPSAHAANNPTCPQHGLVFVTGIGTPSIRVVEEAKWESATLDGCLQCRQGQLSVIAAAQGIAHYPTREEIQDHREIEPAHLRPNVGDITDPALVRPGHFELAVEQIRSHRQSVFGIGRTAELASLLTGNPCRLHQAGDPPASDLLVSTHAKLSVNPRAAVSLSAFLMDLLDLNHQLLIRGLTRRRTTLVERIVATSGHFQNSAKDGQWIVGLLRTDEQESHSLSFAKKAVAFLGYRAPSAGA